MMDGGMCSCPHHKVVPLVITLVGVALLLQVMNVITAQTMSYVWPIAIILVGLMKLSKGMCSCDMKKK
jgi:hypothetical protein